MISKTANRFAGMFTSLTMRALCLFASLFLIGFIPSRALSDCEDFPELGSFLHLSEQLALGRTLQPLSEAALNRLRTSWQDSKTRSQEGPLDHLSVEADIILFMHALNLGYSMSKSGKVDAAQKYATSIGYQSLHLRALVASIVLCHNPASAPAVVGRKNGSQSTAFATGKDAYPLSVEGIEAEMSKAKAWQITGIAIALWGALIVALGAAHTMLLVRESKRRARHICEIPAKVEILNTTLKGDVTILGRYGNRFVPQDQSQLDPLLSMDEGLHCTLQIYGDDVAAKTILSKDSTIGMLFTTPQTSAWVAEMLTRSAIKPHLDYTGRSGAHGERYRLGLGRLVTPNDATSS